MNDVHQKTIILKHTTVKVPGKRPPKATSPVQGSYVFILVTDWCKITENAKKVNVVPETHKG